MAYFSRQLQERLMRLAIAAARRGIRKGQTPFGACIAGKNGAIIASAPNVVWKNTDITAHAEITAIRMACRKLRTIDLSGCSIYSTCEPCPMCFSAIHWAGIRTIIYGASIADAKKCGFSELAITNAQMKRLGKSKVKLVPEVLADECRELFAEFSCISGKRKLY